MQTRSYKKSKFIRRGPYLQESSVCIKMTKHLIIKSHRKVIAPLTPAARQTINHRQPSISGWRLADLEFTA